MVGIGVLKDHSTPKLKPFKWLKPPMPADLKKKNAKKIIGIQTQACDHTEFIEIRIRVFKKSTGNSLCPGKPVQLILLVIRIADKADARTEFVGGRRNNRLINQVRIYIFLIGRVGREAKIRLLVVRKRG